MALVLGHRDVEGLLDMAELIEAMEKAQIQYSLGRAVLPVRTTLEVPKHAGAFRLMPGYLGEDDALGVKVLVRRLHNADIGLPIIYATILLSDAATGRLLAAVEGSSVTAARTAATCGVATRYLARPEASTLAIIGTGRQGRTHLWSMLTVRPIRRVRIYDIRPEASARFKEEMEARFGQAIEVASSPEDAVREADLVVLSTTTATPVVSDRALPRGVHVNSIAAYRPDIREMETETVRRAKLVVDSREMAFEEAGDLLIPMAEGAMGRDHVHAEVGEVAQGLRSGRTSRDELTVYKGVGLATQDVAAAKLLYEKALATGAGVEVDL